MLYMWHNFLTLSDPGISGIGRGQFLALWVSDWEPLLSATLEATSQAGSMGAVTWAPWQAPRVGLDGAF